MLFFLLLDQVFENYRAAEQNRTNLPYRRDYAHRRSNSVPPGLISHGTDYSNGRINSPLAMNVEDDNESFGIQPNSSSYSNSEYYNSDYTDLTQTDDDARTISGLTISTNGSNIGNNYMGDESSTYETFHDYSDDTSDLPDLPLRRVTEGDDLDVF
jgi:hypothetical protein